MSFLNGFFLSVGGANVYLAISERSMVSAALAGALIASGWLHRFLHRAEVMLKLWLARMFGQRITGHDDGATVTGYLWRGKIYITRIVE